jgi:hypothetical protein
MDHALVQCLDDQCLDDQRLDDQRLDDQRLDNQRLDGQCLDGQRFRRAQRLGGSGAGKARPRE